MKFHDLKKPIVPLDPEVKRVCNKIYIKNLRKIKAEFKPPRTIK